MPDHRRPTSPFERPVLALALLALTPLCAALHVGDPLTGTFIRSLSVATPHLRAVMGRFDVPQNFSGDPCTQDEHCELPRTCAIPRPDTVCTNGPLPCACLVNNRIRPCNVSTECLPGDLCALLSRRRENGCVSCKQIAKDRAFLPVDNDRSNCNAVKNPSSSRPTPSTTPTITPTPSARAEGAGRDLDSCAIDKDCALPRTCRVRAPDANDYTPCPLAGQTCVCLNSAPRPCQSAADCQRGEACAFVRELRLCASCAVVDADPDIVTTDDSPTCTSTAASVGGTPSPGDVGSPSPSAAATVPSIPSVPPSVAATSPSVARASPSVTPASPSSARTSPDIAAPPAPTSEPPCIAVQHLQHLKMHELVFVRAVVANVLCDAAGSCATSAHIVELGSRVMTMRSYCAGVGAPCVRRRMSVNSPRMRRGARVPSLTPGLEFTPLAARFGTWAEEALLRALVCVLRL